MPPTRDGTIILDGITCPAHIYPTKTFVTPWLARLGAGEPRFSDLEPSSHLVMRGFGSGLGKHDGDIFEDVGRLWDSKAWTHLPGGGFAGDSAPLGPTRATVMLPGKRNTISGTYNFRPAVRVPYRGAVYVGGDPLSTERGLWVLATGPTYTAVTTAGAPAVNVEVTDLAVQQRYMFIACSTDANVVYFDGTTYVADTVQAHKLCAYLDDWVIYALWNSTTQEITISKLDLTDIATKTTIGTIYSRAAPQRMLSCDNQRGDEVVHIGTQEALWEIDVEAGTIHKYHDLSSRVGEANCRDFIAGCQYVPVEPAGLLEMSPDKRVTEIGFDRDDGLPAGMLAPIMSMWKTERWLFAATGANFYSGTARVASTTATVFVMNLATRTWHWIAEASTTGKDITSVFFCSTIDNKQRLYFWETTYGSTVSTPYYIEIPDATDNPAYAVTDKNAEAAGYVVTPWFNGGFFNLPKALLTMMGQFRNLDADRTIQVLYALDDSAYTRGADTNFTSIVTYNSSATRSSVKQLLGTAGIAQRLGVVFNNIRFKIKLADARATPTMGSGPQLLHLVADYIATPPRLFAWNIRIAQPRGWKGKSGESFVRFVHRVAFEPQLVSFYPTGTDTGTPTAPERYFVRISGVTGSGNDPNNEWVDMVVSEIVLTADQSESGNFPVS